MKFNIKKILHLLGIILLSLIFCISFYYLIINIYHDAAMNKKVFVSSDNVYYKKYQSNIDIIKTNLDNYSYNKNKYKYDSNIMNNFYNKVNYCYNILVKSNIIINENTFLGYKEVNELNNEFINLFVDKCFTTNLLWIGNLTNSNLKEQFNNAKFSIDILTNNSLYLRNELKDNSSYYYNTDYFNQKIRNNLESSYQLILHNYSDFSKIIMDLSNYLTRGERSD